MYCELRMTRNLSIVGGRAFTSRREAVAALRAFLADPPAGWRDVRRTGFRTWRGAGTKIRLECWADNPNG